MRKARIYIPTKTAMQSGMAKQKKWILEYFTRDTKVNPLMGWETSDDTLSEIKLEFETKDKAVEYAKNNKIEFELLEPNKRKFVIKSYSDNFTNN